MSEEEDFTDRWRDAADRYRIATEIGVYGPDRKSMQPHQDEIKALEELLDKFYWGGNPQWMAAEEMLMRSGKEVVLIQWESKPFLTKCMLGHEGFKIVSDMDMPFGMRHRLQPERQLSKEDVAVLLVGHFLHRLHSAENIMKFLIDKIDKIADGAPDEP
ncbi:hypothetical protein A2372_00315 [Candidatus Wolfebacteria bacterium RIFOXYB1_FULL_54_12]|uniref:Uncharacterized protein n=1 Tax=Candidatus Wolfebacteria bacterium RIFOXYB1_FULL_54_12 TaxID=1802559 RepID=A0A1F8DVN4_9BACT|nr:MAG: hypothetical protein A2372_00315 [Candidatus Wolfebacteria bacterium RIFOXYB1_FULL_54_12]